MIPKAASLVVILSVVPTLTITERRRLSSLPCSLVQTPRPPRLGSVNNEKPVSSPLPSLEIHDLHEKTHYRTVVTGTAGIGCAGIGGSDVGV